MLCLSNHKKVCTEEHIETNKNYSHFELVIKF